MREELTGLRRAEDVFFPSRLLILEPRISYEGQ